MNKRASNITPELSNRIIRLIESFSESISWNSVIEKIKKETGEHYTEQGLRKHKAIAEAFRIKKVKLAKQRELSGNKQYRIATANKLLELEAENAILKEQNERLKEKFVIWAHNAASRNVTEEQLNEPIEVHGQV